MYNGAQEYTNPLAVAAAALATSYGTATATSSIAAEGTQEMLADVEATFDAAPNATSIEYRFACSDDDGTSWRAVATYFLEDMLPGKEVSIAAMAGTTVKKKIGTTAHGSSKLVRLETKATGVAAGADASACSKLRMVI